jgi:hypothetical protein
MPGWLQREDVVDGERPEGRRFRAVFVFAPSGFVLIALGLVIGLING